MLDLPVLFHSGRWAARLVRLAPLVLLLSCELHPTQPDLGPDAPGPDPLGNTGPFGLMEVTFSAIGDGNPVASARSISLSPTPGTARRAGDGSLEGQFALNPVEAGAQTGIQLEAVSTGSFTSGERGVDGVRYLYATFRVRNASIGGTPYNTPRTNLTFMAVATGSTIDESAIRLLRKFDGSDADAAIALAMRPAGAVYQDESGSVRSRFPDVLQAFAEADIVGLQADVNPGVIVLPYGFMVNNPASPANPASRILPASPLAGVFNGVVTFAFRVPLEDSAADDPFTLSLVVLPVDDDDTRVTESFEEIGDSEASLALQNWASGIGATQLTALPGGIGLADRELCPVRSAGTAASPTAYLAAPDDCD